MICGRSGECSAVEQIRSELSTAATSATRDCSRSTERESGERGDMVSFAHDNRRPPSKQCRERRSKAPRSGVSQKIMGTYTLASTDATCREALHLTGSAGRPESVWYFEKVVVKPTCVGVHTGA